MVKKPERYSNVVRIPWRFHQQSDHLNSDLSYHIVSEEEDNKTNGMMVNQKIKSCQFQIQSFQFPLKGAPFHLLNLHFASEVPLSALFAQNPS